MTEINTLKPTKDESNTVIDAEAVFNARRKAEAERKRRQERRRNGAGLVGLAGVVLAAGVVKAHFNDVDRSRAAARTQQANEALKKASMPESAQDAFDAMQAGSEYALQMRPGVKLYDPRSLGSDELKEIGTLEEGEVVINPLETTGGFLLQREGAKNLVDQKGKPNPDAFYFISDTALDPNSDGEQFASVVYTDLAPKIDGTATVDLMGDQPTVWPGGIPVSVVTGLGE